MPEADRSFDITKNPRFATARRGYQPEQVDEHIKRLIDELNATARHRDEAGASVSELTKALSYAQKELAETKEALSRTIEDPAGPAAMTERVKAMMQLAEEEISELRSKAENEAKSTREAADAYAEKTRQEARDEAERLAKEAEEKRNELNKESEEQRDRLDAEAEQRRSDAEQELDKELATQRAEAEKAAEELERSAKERADAMLADAEQQRAKAAQQRVEAVELRKAVADGLMATNTALQNAIANLGSEIEVEDEKTLSAENTAPDTTAEKIETESEVDAETVEDTKQEV